MAFGIMGFEDCHSPVWRRDDFTQCFEDRWAYRSHVTDRSYLRTLLPSFICAVSILHLLYYILSSIFNSKFYHAYSLLEDWRSPWSFQESPGEQREEAARRFTDDPSESPAADADALIEEEFNRNAQSSLVSATPVTSSSHIESDKPRAELSLVSIELALIAAQLAVAVALFVAAARGMGSQVATAVGLVHCTYVLVLVSVRFVFTLWKRPSNLPLWYHTAFLYMITWIINAVLLRSAILHPVSRLSQNLQVAQFALISCQTAIALGSRSGNKTIDIEYEEDIQPAREALSSIFSYVTFSWVDAIVWAGYKKTTEITDVWNLTFEDKAATVLSNYRNFKRKSSLWLHLLSYFRRELLLQAFWAGISGVLTFIPTILLREILRYIENPESVPRNTAWLFVVLLFVSGCASAVVDGQALWIGRHVCVRLRAIIIGELYAKALKRKVAAPTDNKILGEKKGDKPSFIRRIINAIRGDGKAEEDNQIDGKKAASEDSVSSGTIINLMAVDSFKIAEIGAYLHYLWAATPVQLIMSIVLLYQTMGFSCIAGLGMMVVLLPVNLFISKQFTHMQTKILAATDGRIHVTNEVLTNIRIIKFFAWEQRFLANIDEKRKVELKHLRARYILWASAATIWGGSPILITFLSFAVYTLVEGKDLVPSVAFTALSLFQLLRVPLDQLADMVAHVQEAKVSIDRVDEFLSEEDTQKYRQLWHRKTDEDVPLIGFVKATSSWSDETAGGSEAFRLMDLTLQFVPEELNVIAGPTGSGKTSLLLALLGEMTLVEGAVYLPGAKSREEFNRDPQTGLTDNVAYCAQQAWLVNGTVKENIIFASPWDQGRYDQVIKACALIKDFQILDKGDETLVGEKGVTLSGGQKQRISLARALYSPARHVLLDDVLSAVDSHTAKFIFDEALMGPLMQRRTCLLVTHNVSLCLPSSRYAVLLENGRVAVHGTANEVIESGKLGSELKSMPPSRAISRSGSRVPSADNVAAMKGNVLAAPTGPLTSDENHAGVNGIGATDKLTMPSKGLAQSTATPSAQAMQEAKAEGSVKLSIIFLYLRAMGSWRFWTMAAIIFVTQQISSVSTNLWIRQWANAYTSQQYATNVSLPVRPLCHDGGVCLFTIPAFGNVGLSENDAVDAGYYLGVYMLLGGLFMLVTFLHEGICFAGSLSASQVIHTRLINAVCRAKFRFFDSTPLGQIMNRFSKDIENIDQEIAPTAVGVIHCLATILTIVVLISAITPGFLIAGVFITVMYFLIGYFYINSSRDLKRLESVLRSPLYQQFGETLSGMTTIRAYGDERRFVRDNLKQINNHGRPFIYLWAANRWLAFRVDIAGAFVAFFSGVFVVLSIGRIDAGAAGLALTYAVSFTENVLWFVRLYASNEQNMNSVERIKEYLDVEQEAEAIIPGKRPPGDWPSQGTVEFKKYSTRYRQDFEMVLNELSFTINPCEKVGVVGRTGAGKSSLAMALFRALEAEQGSILVDGVDISQIGLQDLRENIVMVPQDPTLFSGTLRSNLDPFTLFTDEEIFDVLRRVQLIDSSAAGTPLKASGTATPVRPQTPMVEINGHATDDAPTLKSAQSDNKNVFYDLSSPVAELGNNLSQGQRQLLCLARALLKEPKILLMDEATASIDYATDAKVQDTIRQLKNNTIITIAHRLKTIVDYDRVIVMDKGRVVEMGTPWELLDPTVGGGPERRWFRDMCETSGELEMLEREALRGHETRGQAVANGHGTGNASG